MCEPYPLRALDRRKIEQCALDGQLCGGFRRQFAEPRHDHSAVTTRPGEIPEQPGAVDRAGSRRGIPRRTCRSRHTARGWRGLPPIRQKRRSVTADVFSGGPVTDADHYIG